MSVHSDRITIDAPPVRFSFLVEICTKATVDVGTSTWRSFLCQLPHLQTTDLPEPPSSKSQANSKPVVLIDTRTTFPATMVKLSLFVGGTLNDESSYDR
jgi:hypothetical protein